MRGRRPRQQPLGNAVVAGAPCSGDGGRQCRHICRSARQLQHHQERQRVYRDRQRGKRRHLQPSREHRANAVYGCHGQSPHRRAGRGHSAGRAEVAHRAVHRLLQSRARSGRPCLLDRKIQGGRKPRPDCRPVLQRRRAIHQPDRLFGEHEPFGLRQDHLQKRAGSHGDDGPPRGRCAVLGRPAFWRHRHARRAGAHHARLGAQLPRTFRMGMGAGAARQQVHGRALLCRAAGLELQHARDIDPAHHGDCCRGHAPRHRGGIA